MKKYLYATFVAMFLLPFFFGGAVAQSNEAKFNGFVTSLRQELLAESDVVEVKSVNLKNDVVVIEGVASNADIPAGFLCDVLLAASKYAMANPSKVPTEQAYALSEMHEAGISFKITIADVPTGKKHDVNLTAKEFAGFYMLGNLADDPKMMTGLISSLPFERIIAMLNLASQGSGSSFSCENGRVYMVNTLDNGQFLEMKRVYEFDKVAFTTAMSQAMLSSFKSDEGSMTILDMIHEHGYKLALKITSPGMAPIVLDLE